MKLHFLIRCRNIRKDHLHVWTCQVIPFHWCLRAQICKLNVTNVHILIQTSLKLGNYNLIKVNSQSYYEKHDKYSTKGSIYHPSKSTAMLKEQAKPRTRKDQSLIYEVVTFSDIKVRKSTSFKDLKIEVYHFMMLKL